MQMGQKRKYGLNWELVWEVKDKELKLKRYS